MKHKFLEFVKGEKRPKSYDTFYPSIDNLEDAGWFIGTKVVVIDLDSHNEKEKKKLNDISDYILAKYPTFWIQGNRGKHLYYKKSVDLNKRQIKGICVGGFELDYLTGAKAVDTLKMNGIARKTSESIYDIDFNTLPELPRELYLIPKSKNCNMLCMKDGDGRNETLYKHLLNVKETLDIDISYVANFINDYVFEDKLKEINTVIESVSKKETSITNYYDGKTIKVNEYSQFLIKEKHICKINNQLYVFNGEIYLTGKLNIEKAMIEYIPNILSAKRVEVYKMLELIAPSREYADENYIAFKNGIYNLDTDRLLDFNPDIIVTNQIPHNYDPSIYNEKMEEILNTWVNGNKDTRLLLDECIGMCMYRSNKIGACFILTGTKDNGKSTFINMLKVLLGKDNYSSIGLHDIERRFRNFNIVGKLANLGDDIGDEYIAKTEMFKKLVTGETVQLEQKGKDVIDYDNYAKLIFNANEIPNIKDPTGAVIDKRIIYIPFNTTFTSKNKDVNLSKKFKEDESLMTTLINFGIAGVKRVIDNNQFTISEESAKLKEDFKKNNDIVYMFIEEYGKERIINMDEAPILYAYQEYCKANNSPSGSQKILRAGIKKILNCEVRRRDTSKSEMKANNLIRRSKVPYYAPVIVDETNKDCLK